MKYSTVAILSVVALAAASPVKSGCKLIHIPRRLPSKDGTRLIAKARTNITTFPAANTARSVTSAVKREPLFGFGRDGARERDRDDDKDDDKDDNQNAIVIILGLDNDDDDKKKQEGKLLSSSFLDPFSFIP